MLMLIAAVACTNAVAPAPGPRSPWPLALAAYVLWLVASFLAVFLPTGRRRDT